MFLREPKDSELKNISLQEFYDDLIKYVQPERLNPEDAKSVCDSPNSENK